MPYNIRFQLQKGKNYLKWQIKDVKTGEVNHIDPNKKVLVMYGCELRNGKKTAQKIFDGAHKTVCAYIRCQDYVLIDVEDGTRLPVVEGYRYNPRVAPNWTRVSDGENMDKKNVGRLRTFRHWVYEF